MRNEPIAEGCNVLETLLQLDHLTNPGITSDRFAALFVQCRCGLVTTRRAFTLHYCRPQVIDLTGDSEDSDSMVLDLTQDD